MLLSIYKKSWLIKYEIGTLSNLREIGLIETDQLAIGEDSEGVAAHRELIAHLVNEFSCELGLQARKVWKDQIFVHESESDFDHLSGLSAHACCIRRLWLSSNSYHYLVDMWLKLFSPF